MADQKKAEEAIILAITALPSSHRPADLNAIIWNGVQYRDFTPGTGLNGSGGWSGITTSTTYSHCDHDPDELDKESKLLKNSPFSIGSVAIIGATKAKIAPLVKRKKRRLIMNCSGSSISGSSYAPKPVEKPFTKVPKEFESFFTDSYAWTMPEVTKTKLFYGDEVVVDWPDQKAAPIHPSFWVDLLAKIQSDEFQAKYLDVVFCCFGGHGRTGTALASLAIVAGIYADKGVSFKNDKTRVPTLAEKAEVWIQHDYCKKAVESDDQTEYLACVEEFYTSLLTQKEVEKIG